MAATEVIKSYLVGLGFKWDEDSLRKFDDSMRKVHTTVRNFALGMTGLAVAVEEAVRRTAQNYESLYYLAERTGTSAANLKSLGYAWSQVGLQAGQAGQTISSVATAFRNNMNLEPWLKGMIGSFQGAEGAVQQLADQYEALLKLPNTPENQARQIQLREIMKRVNVDPETILQVSKHNREIKEWQKDAIEIYKRFGLDIDQATGRAVGMQQQYRRVWEYMGAAFDKVAVILMPKITQLFNRFADWLAGEGGDKLTDWIDDIEEWVDNFSLKGVEEGFNKVLSILNDIWDVVKFIHKYLGDWGTILLAAFGPTILKAALWQLTSSIVAAFFGTATSAAAAGAAAGSAYAGSFTAALTKIIGGFAVAALLAEGLKQAGDAVDEWMNKHIPNHGKKQAQMILEEDKKKSERGTLGNILNAPNDLGDWIFGDSAMKSGLEYLRQNPDMPGAKEYFARNPHRAAKPDSYSSSPFPAAFGGNSTNNLLESIYLGFQHWWSGSGSFKPFVVMTEEFYNKLTDVLEEVFFGAKDRNAASGGGGGGGGGGSRMVGGRLGGAGPRTSNQTVGNIDMTGTGAGHVASKEERIAYYRQKAAELGLNPDAIVQTVATEGLNNYVGDSGKSFGDFQLFTGGGMGNQAEKAGINLRDPNTWKAQADFAMGQMAAHKGDARWFASQWHGPRNNAPWAVENFSNPNATLPTAAQGGGPRGAGAYGVPGAVMNYGGTGALGKPGENLTTITTAGGKKVQVNAASAESFKGFLNDLEKTGYKIDSIGGFSNREKRGGSGYSEHAFGNAIDINPGRNPFQSNQTDMPANIHDIAAKWGLIWGGDWKSPKDTMHFQWGGSKPWLNQQDGRQGQGSVMASAASITENSKSIVASVKMFDQAIGHVSKGLSNNANFVSRSASVIDYVNTKDHPGIAAMNKSIAERHTRISRGADAAAGANTYHNVVMNVNGEDSNAVGKSVSDHLNREFTRAAQHAQRRLF
jgi:D-alanyl-D-alanine carboxypeptidase